MHHRSRRMILPRGHGRDHAVAAIRALGAADPPVPTGLRDHFTAPGGVTVVLDHDGPAERLFVQVTGEAEEAVAATASKLDSALGPLSYAALIDQYDQAETPRARAEAILLLGLGAPPAPDEAFTERIRAAMNDPDPTVREGAAQATSRYTLPT